MAVTSYIKMIDIWMLFTMTMPFLEVILHTTNEMFKQPGSRYVGPNKRVGVVRVKSAENQGEAQQQSPEQQGDEEEDIKTVQSVMKMTGKLIFPICSLIFTFVFCIVGLLVSYIPDDQMDPNMTECLTIRLD